MFLSDELEQIFNKKGITPGISADLFNCCLKRVEKSINEYFITKNSHSVLTELKRIDYTWRTFCKSHPVFKPEVFREAFLNLQKPELAEKLKRELNW